jgi:putative transposase
MFDELFSLFDPDQEVEISQHNLPHWQQAGKTYFITFRTYDSMPRDVMDAWLNDRNRWLRNHGIEPLDVDWRRKLARLPIDAKREFHRNFTDRFHDLLDECHGACVLRRPDLAKIVGDSLLHFNGDRYEMGDFVVMPNHVHLLVQFTTASAMKDQCRSWKHYTAVQINRTIGASGTFWQGESFDFLVRTPEQFEAIRRYIEENPIRAKLRAGEFLHYRRK